MPDNGNEVYGERPARNEENSGQLRSATRTNLEERLVARGDSNERLEARTPRGEQVFAASDGPRQVVYRGEERPEGDRPLRERDERGPQYESRQVDVPCAPEGDRPLCDTTSKGQNHMRSVSITQINYGYIVKIDCHTFAFEKPETFLKVLTEYMKDPEATERKWYAGKLL